MIPYTVNLKDTNQAIQSCPLPKLVAKCSLHCGPESFKPKHAILSGEIFSMGCVAAAFEDAPEDLDVTIFETARSEMPAVHRAAKELVAKVRAVSHRSGLMQKAFVVCSHSVSAMVFAFTGALHRARAILYLFTQPCWLRACSPIL